jgi:hypothetical protein
MVFPMKLGDDHIRDVAGPAAFDGHAAPRENPPQLANTRLRCSQN